MPLTPAQIEHIEKLKREFRVDQNLGATVSEQSRSHGHFAGIDPVTLDQGRAIISSTFNPTIMRIVAALDDK